MADYRQERLNKILFQFLSNLFQFELMDERLENVTIEYVNISSDMRDATVFYSVFDESRKNIVLTGLDSARSYLHKKMAETLNLRITPKLHFKYHNIENKATHLEKIIENEKPRYES